MHTHFAAVHIQQLAPDDTPPKPNGCRWQRLSLFKAIKRPIHGAQVKGHIPKTIDPRTHTPAPPRRRYPQTLLLILFLSLIAAVAQHAWALDDVVFQREGQRIHVAGRVVIEAEDGGLLVLARDGVLWAVQPDELKEHKSSDQPFNPMDADQLHESLIEEMPPGFQIHKTAHYVVCFNTSKEYAKWCGALYERLYRAFHNYWNRRKVQLHEPEMPLVALVFEDKPSYTRYTTNELGEAIDSVIGYYNLRTNRVTMYDLTGIDALRSTGNRKLSAQQINRLLARPEVERTVATIVHEATHQIAFNCGLHQRYADIPLWVSEGIAMYFETPDLNSPRGWRTIGAVNNVRLKEFRALLRQRTDDSLHTLITDDQRFRDPQQAKLAYPESWALVYYLMRHRPDEFADYMRTLAAKTPLLNDGNERRRSEFEAAFSGTLNDTNTDFLRQMRRVRK